MAGDPPPGGWCVRVAVVDATLADATSPDVVAVQHRVPRLDGALVDIDVPEPPAGRRWELQVHARPLTAGAAPELDRQVRVGDVVTMVALPVPAATEALEAPVRSVTS